MDALLSNPYVAALITMLTLVAGAFMVALPYIVRNYPAVHPSSRLGRLERAWFNFRTWLRVKHRIPELGGYVHDTHMSQYIPPTLNHEVTGTWTSVAGTVADTIARNVAAADATCTVNIPIIIPSNSVANKGAYLRSVELDFEIFTAALDACSAVFNIVTRGADGSAHTVAAQTFTYDAGHDDASERIDIDQHKMTLTLTTPVWLDNDQYALVELTLDKAATSTVHMLGSVANYTLRL